MHASGSARRSSRASLFSAFVRAGQTGVDLFLLLSGFLLSPPFLADVAGGRRVRARDFLARDLLHGVPYLVFRDALPLLLAPPRASGALSNRVLARIGVLSYSIYLIHRADGATTDGQRSDSGQNAPAEKPAGHGRLKRAR